MGVTPVRLVQSGENAHRPSIANRAVQDLLTGSAYAADGSDFSGFAKKSQYTAALNQWGPKAVVGDFVGRNYIYFGGTAIAIGGGISFVNDGSIVVADNTTSYVERSYDGVVSTNTAGFTPGKIPMARVTAAAGAITAVDEWRPMVGPYPYYTTVAGEVGVIDTRFKLGDPRRNGAALDGVTDSTAASANTVASMAAVNLGGEFIVPKGTLLISTLSFAACTNGVLIRGEGSNRNSRIKQKAGATTDMLVNGGAAAIEMTNVYIDGNTANTPEANRFSTLQFSGAPDLKVHNCYFTKTNHAAIRLDGITGSVHVYENLFRDLSEWPGTGGILQGSYGIYGSSTIPSTGNISVHHNVFKQSGLATLPNVQPCGFQMDAGPAGLATLNISFNEFDYFGSNRGTTQPSGPIDLYQFFRHVTIIGNKIKHSSMCGIKIGNTTDLVIACNTISDDNTDNRGAAIFVGNHARNPAADYHNVIISGNVIEEWRNGYDTLGFGTALGIGIHIVGDPPLNVAPAKRWIVANNLIRKCGVGIYCDGTGDVEFDSNHIYEAARYSFQPLDIQGTIVIRGGIMKDCANQHIFHDSTGTDLGKNMKIFIDGVTFENASSYDINIQGAAANLIPVVSIRNCKHLDTGHASANVQYAAMLYFKNNEEYGTIPAFPNNTTVRRGGSTWDVLYSAPTAYAGGAIGAGASVFQLVGVTGAALGDNAKAKFSADLAGVDLTCQVNIADQVRCIFTNKTAGALTPAGNIQAIVEKQ